MINIPFKSRQQAKFMFSQHPKIAKEFAKKTPSIKALPKYADSAQESDQDGEFSDDFDDMPMKKHLQGVAGEKLYHEEIADIDKTLGFSMTKCIEKMKHVKGIKSAPAFCMYKYKKGETADNKRQYACLLDNSSSCSHPHIELATNYVKKVWNTEKNKFDYIYPEDIQKKNRSIAKDTLRASEKGTIPSKMNIIGLAQNVTKKSEYADNSIKEYAQKITTMKHCDAKSCDHYKDSFETTNCVLKEISVSPKGECNNYEPVPKENE